MKESKLLLYISAFVTFAFGTIFLYDHLFTNKQFTTSAAKWFPVKIVPDYLIVVYASRLFLQICIFSRLVSALLLLIIAEPFAKGESWAWWFLVSLTFVPQLINFGFWTQFGNVSSSLKYPDPFLLIALFYDFLSRIGRTRILIALGENAVIKAREKRTAENYIRNANSTAQKIAELIKRGYQLTLTHGVGHQTGEIFLQNQLSGEHTPEMPLHVCSAKSQGMMGYILQQALHNRFVMDGIELPVVTLLSQAEVDPSCQHPTKPIGKIYSEAEAQKLRQEGKHLIEEIGRGYRIAVSTPTPERIIESESIIRLVKSGQLVICGSGIPVSRNPATNILEGKDVIIDKDKTSSKIAQLINAEKFVLATDVEFVYLNFQKENQQVIRKMTVIEARQYIAEGHFEKRTMLPKIESAIEFVEKTGRKALICSLDKICDALEGESGTVITMN